MRRASHLYSEILDLLVAFVVAYVNTTHDTDLCPQLFTLLFSSSEDEANEFTLGEQLHVLKQLNFLFYQLPGIRDNSDYWRLIREGLQDTDQACRKMALQVLKENLKSFTEEMV